MSLPSLALRLELVEQPVHLTLLFERGKLLFHVVAGEFGRRRRGSFGVAYLLLHAVEGGRVSVAANGASGLRRLVEGARAPGLGDESIALGLGLLQLLL